jgi:hypothetical protein
MPNTFFTVISWLLGFWLFITDTNSFCQAKKGVAFFAITLYVDV